MTHNRKSTEIGDEGERLAREHLEKLGHQILELKWRYGKYEIDIISRLGDTIVFIEVKTRKNGTFGDPQDFVTRKKQKRLVSAANFYLIDRDIELEARFDIVSVMPTPGGAAINHLENAFYPVLK